MMTSNARHCVTLPPAIKSRRHEAYCYNEIKMDQSSFNLVYEFQDNAQSSFMAKPW